MESESAPEPWSRLKSFAREVYDAQAGTKSPLLDGPWWLAATLAVALAVFTFAGSPWKWVGLPVVALLFWLPFIVKWVAALARTVPEFREGYRS